MTEIISTKDTLGGKPRISGTRISVDIIYNYVRDGAIDQLNEDYPHLKKEQIEAAVDYLDKRVHRAKEKLGASAA